MLNIELNSNNIKNIYDVKNNDEVKLIHMAYMFNEKYDGKNSFESYVSKETSVILANSFGADINTIVASLIYRNAIKHKCSDKQIKEMFNADIMYKVRLLGKFDMDLFDDTDKNRLWMIHTILVDVKISIIKLVERVSVLHYFSEEKFKNYQNYLINTLEFYVPIAQLLGIYNLKNNLEDLCFRYDSNYEEASLIVKKATERYNDIIERVKEKFDESDLTFKDDVKFKLNKKSNYDIFAKYNKINKKISNTDDSDFKISGFCSIKCLTKEKQECYSMLCFIHQFSYQFGSFCDYISGFQGDEYKAIHTNVFIDSHLIDFRICTDEMDNINYYGITYDWQNKPNLQDKLMNKYAFYGDLEQLIGKETSVDILRRFKEDIVNKRVDLNEYNVKKNEKILK